MTELFNNRATPASRIETLYPLESPEPQVFYDSAELLLLNGSDAEWIKDLSRTSVSPEILRDLSQCLINDYTKLGSRTDPDERRIVLGARDRFLELLAPVSPGVRENWRHFRQTDGYAQNLDLRDFVVSQRILWLCGVSGAEPLEQDWRFFALQPATLFSLITPRPTGVYEPEIASRARLLSLELIEGLRTRLDRRPLCQTFDEEWLRQIGAPHDAERIQRLQALSAEGSRDLRRLSDAEKLTTKQARQDFFELLGWLREKHLLRPALVNFQEKNHRFLPLPASMIQMLRVLHDYNMIATTFIADNPAVLHESPQRLRQNLEALEEHGLVSGRVLSSATRLAFATRATIATRIDRVRRWARVLQWQVNDELAVARLIEAQPAILKTSPPQAFSTRTDCRRAQRQ